MNTEKMSRCRIKSYVGGHEVSIYADCVYDESIRKYRGGRVVAVIPYSGRMLSARIKPQETSILMYDGVGIPVSSPQEFEAVDELPPVEECEYCVVSAMYAAACRALGVDTSRLLTIGAPVADEAGHVVGTVGLNRN